MAAEGEPYADQEEARSMFGQDVGLDAQAKGAQAALAALQTWDGRSVEVLTAVLRQPEGDELLSDVLSDLRHLADLLGLDWQQITDRADRFHEEDR